MDSYFLGIPTAWLDWIAVCGYIGFAAFIAWRVMGSR
jgi:hypothetical protein